MRGNLRNNQKMLATLDKIDTVNGPQQPIPREGQGIDPEDDDDDISGRKRSVFTYYFIRQHTMSLSKINKKIKGKLGTGLLPSDVMLHIACLSRPRDLFALSFTSKLNYQMIGSAPLIWERARLRYMPCRALPPPTGMTEKAYAWLLITDRCLRCHLVKPLKIDWTHRAKCCYECIDVLNKDCLIETHPQLQDSLTRRGESKSEAKLNNEDCVKRLKDLGGDGRWDKAILAKIPRYANVVDGLIIAPEDNAFELIKSHICKGILHLVLYSSL
jgi:hypothetical protein